MTNLQWYRVQSGTWQSPGRTPVSPSGPASNSLADVQSYYEATTGPRSSLTPYTAPSGNMVIDKNSSTVPSIVSSGDGSTGNPYLITNKQITLPSGYISLLSGTAVFRDCEIICNYTPAVGSTTPFGIGMTSSGVTDGYDQLVFDHCELHSGVPTPLANGVYGRGISIYNCSVYHVGDGLGPNVSFSSGSPSTPNVYFTCEDSWVHDHSYFMGAYSPKDTGATSDYYANSGSSPTNGTVLVNPGGDYFKPDGGHNDGCQPQTGANGRMVRSFLDDFNDISTITGGVTPWMRMSQNDLTTANGNGYSVFGTYSPSASIQFNWASASAAPTNNWTVTDNYFRGGRFAIINWAYGGYQDHVFRRNTFLEGVTGSGAFGGATVPPWTSTGPGGYDPLGNPVTGTQSQSWSPGYPISLGTSGSNHVDYSTWDVGDNVDWLGNSIPVRNINSAIIDHW